MDKNFRKDRFPIDTGCRCYTCQTYSRMVLRYLFFSHDPLAETLATIHNLTFYQDLMRDIRIAIEKHQFEAFRQRWLDLYGRKSASEPRRGDGPDEQKAPERAPKSSKPAAPTKHSDVVQRVLQRFGRR
jgi:queuine tRNA-ribosyltransferase